MTAFSLADPLPESAFISLGGYRTVRQAPWQAYLNQAIRKAHPGYFFRHLFTGRRDQRWLQNNCVLEALAQYAFTRFGVLLPRDNLFKVYNERGLGVLPEAMVRVIQALVAPLGLAIDRLVVPDEALAQAVAPAGLLTPGGEYYRLDGLPGVAMINVAEGYSHAFFWDAIQARKFGSPQFRIALTLKWAAEGDAQREDRCVENSLRAFCTLAARLLASSGGQAGKAQAALDGLSGLLADCSALDWVDNRALAADALAALLAEFPPCRQRAEVVEAAGLAQAALGADIRARWHPLQALRLDLAGA